MQSEREKDPRETKSIKRERSRERIQRKKLERERQREGRGKREKGERENSLFPSFFYFSFSLSLFFLFFFFFFSFLVLLSSSFLFLLSLPDRTEDGPRGGLVARLRQRAMAWSDVRQQVEVAVEPKMVGSKVRLARNHEEIEKIGDRHFFFCFLIIGRSSTARTFREER